MQTNSTVPNTNSANNGANTNATKKQPRTKVNNTNNIANIIYLLITCRILYKEYLILQENYSQEYPKDDDTHLQYYKRLALHDIIHAHIHYDLIHIQYS